MSNGASISPGTPYTASIAAGQTLQVPLTLYVSGKYVWQNDPSVAVLTGVYQGAVVAPDAGMLRVCGANAWGTRTLQAGTYTVTLKQPDGATPAAIAPTVLIRPWSFWDYFAFGFLFFPDQHPSTC